MKIVINIGEQEEESDKEEMMPRKAPSAFQLKVARMLAKKAGRKGPTEMDMEKAAELEHDKDD